MEDRQIVELFWHREESAIAAVSEAYGRYCTAIAMNILGSTEDAGECVNDTYLQAWNSIPPHRPERLAAFLGKITRNLALNRYRDNRAEKRGGGELPLVLDELAECVLSTGSVEAAFEQKELGRALDAFLGTLSAQKRAMFVCRYWYTDSIADIAARFGMKESAVAMTLSRTRQKLHVYLTERGF